jgi:hypothetical protein
VLFFFGGVVVSVAGVRCDGVVVVVAPFCEVVCELKTGGVGGGVFKVNDDELFVRVGWEEKGRFTGWFEAKDVAILCLGMISSQSHNHYERLTSL